MAGAFNPGPNQCFQTSYVRMAVTIVWLESDSRHIKDYQELKGYLRAKEMQNRPNT